MESICIFCGSSTGNRSIYQEAAQAMGEAIARRGLSLVYGGGNVGLMGMVADAALAAGGEVIGVIPKFLVDKEIAHNGLTQLHVVDSMHDRKALMTELADAFIALPGGYGTLEEFCEILTWAQLGLHQKPQGLLNVEGYYNPLLQLFDRAVTEEFLKSELRSLVLESSVPEDLLNLLASYQPITVEKWLRQDTEA
ncbi:LOG family protein [Scytonema millei]|uniref:Cytokinin riboside 5'-monophosphate phosphoribohydrolase n=1 Tax=Scytonema millei VB511283 TaxID=1245923 RepID=A0A9X5E3P9_9CYAN|nr:TIGR00730 family Rossman fold protein [Scytonema millei]NHC34554.1 TIGR00730 family Rossman fold protein [Scytonema millei VB511283]